MIVRKLFKAAVHSAAAWYSLLRRTVSGKTKLLFYAGNPMHYTMFRPIHKKIGEVSDSEVFFCLEAPGNDHAAYIRLGVPKNRIVSMRKARLGVWDAVVLADFKRPKYLRADRLVYICHGVAAKKWSYVDEKGGRHTDDYRYHYSLKQYDLVLFHNAADYHAAKQRGLFKRENAGEVTGMCCLDEVIGNHEPGKVHQTRRTYVPPQFLGKKVILYAPTWDSTASFARKGQEILTALSLMDAFVIVKPHPLCITSEVGVSGLDLATFLQKRFSRGNYLLITDTPYDIMPITDMMISDFSSITFEYTLLRKPVFLFEAADKEEKIADWDQYEMLKACCFVFQEHDQIDKNTFSTRPLGPEKISAMKMLQEKYFANAGNATAIAVQKLQERGIIISGKPASKSAFGASVSS